MVSYCRLHIQLLANHLLIPIWTVLHLDIFFLLSLALWLFFLSLTLQLLFLSLAHRWIHLLKGGA